MSDPLDERMWSMVEVCERTGLSYGTIRQMAKDGSFPKSRRTGPRLAMWLASEVVAWMHATPIATPDDPGIPTVSRKARLS